MRGTTPKGMQDTT
jgi:hypothetical protein